MAMTDATADEPEVDLAPAREEVAAAFSRYERALLSNDLATLDQLFSARSPTVRVGLADRQDGYAAIRALPPRPGPPGATAAAAQHGDRHLRPAERGGDHRLRPHRRLAPGPAVPDVGALRRRMADRGRPRVPERGEPGQGGRRRHTCSSRAVTPFAVGDRRRTSCLFIQTIRA